jgi:ubiquinone/menaquinone biosynthesis C-methylase UbiE
MSGSIGVDKTYLEGVDIVSDLFKGLPFKDNSVDLIYCSHFLEHVDDFFYFIEELHRVLKPGGKIKASVPYYTSIDSYTDPTHKHFFTEATFNYFTDKWLYGYYSKARFKIEKISFNYYPKIRYLPFKKYLRKFLMNTVQEIFYELTAVK